MGQLQFSTPGWVPQFAGFGCSATQWCANLTIDSLSDQDNTGVTQNADCVNPPIGAKFYPIYTLARADGRCWFQQGDVHVPGTVNRFGGTSTSEFGHLLFVHYANAGFTTLRLAEDFHRDLHGNPCTSH